MINHKELGNLIAAFPYHWDQENASALYKIADALYEMGLDKAALTTELCAQEYQAHYQGQPDPLVSKERLTSTAQTMIEYYLDARI